MCFISWLVKQLFIKLGWAKASSNGDSCSLSGYQQEKGLVSDFYSKFEVKE